MFRSRSNPVHARWPSCALALLLATIVLAGCAATPSEPVGSALEREQAYRAHQRWLEAIERFRSAGRLALRMPEESVSATMDWRQERDAYDVRLSGPFGTGAVRIEGAPGAVRLSTADGRSTVARSAEDLLARELGWQVPVSVLRYWLVGAVAPELGLEQLELDDDGRVLRMLQAGWDVRYLDYTEVSGGALPKRLAIEGPQLRLRLVITRWTT